MYLPQALQSFDKLEINADLIRLFGCDNPSYTLYPTSDRFVEAFDVLAYTTWVNNRGIGGVRRPLSLYVHIPFCSSLCLYCNDNKIVTDDSTGIRSYLKYLSRETNLQGQLFHDTTVEQLHFGGGAPIFLSDMQLSGLMNEIRQKFNLKKDGDYSVEVDPRRAVNMPMKALKAMGFTRVIVVTQDYDQQAHSVQTEDDILRVILAAKREGFNSISVELVYGLPQQSIEKFDASLEKIISAKPDQITLLHYLHLPEKFKQQRRIYVEDFSLAQSRLEIMLHAINRLSDAGYIYIGLNHFARYDDKLVVAQQQGRLHYNLQGFSIHTDSDLVALGVSAIGNIGPTYSQNYRNLHQYYGRLEQNILPVIRGLELTVDDLLRRFIMHALICHSALAFESVETFFPVNFKQYFSNELAVLLEYEKFGLLTLEDDEITITPRGKLLMSSICMVFDKYHQASNKRKHYSSII